MINKHCNFFGTRPNFFYTTSPEMEAARSEPCDHLSENSIIISISGTPPCQNIPTVGQNEEKWIPQEEDQKQKQDQTNSPVLDLSLSSMDLDQGSKPQVNFLDSFLMDSAIDSSDNHQSSDTERRVFSCNYCQRKFYSSQALGGHQNAHKRERTIAKRGQQRFSAASAAALGHDSHLHGYSSMASLPLHGSFNRSLGIQAHSMIHKPSSQPSQNGSPHIYGQNVWARKPMDQQPAVGRLTPENYYPSTSSSVGGAARFNSVWTIPPPAEGGGGHKCHIATHLKPNQDELQKLDLSLKL